MAHEEHMEELDLDAIPEDGMEFDFGEDTGKSAEKLVEKAEVKKADDLEVDVEDDTPLEDRNRKPLVKDALAEDDEAEQYTEKVKKRISELRHQAHDERRRKETAERERDEAIRFARENHARMRELEQRLTHGEASYATEVMAKAKLAVDAAKDKHRRAYEAGDADAMADAAADLAAAKQEEMNAKRWSEQAAQNVQKIPSQKDEFAVDSEQSRQRAAPQQEQTPRVDPRAQDWAKKNAWFGSDATMTSLAYGVHEHLIRSGVDPAADADTYYAAIDKEMRRRFPEYEWPDAKPAEKTKRTATVAPVTRAPTGNKNRVVLTKSQVRVAENLGLTPEQYARELQKLSKGA